MADLPKVLVLGDGDLSFSATLCSQPLRLVATTLEPREELRRRYPGASAHIKALEEAGATVLHQVDATSLRIEGSWCCDFQRIIFNFPYQATGGIKGLRRLLGSFLEEAAQLLSPDGCIEVTLCAGQGGTAVDSERGWAGSWRVPLLAARAMLALKSVTLWEPPANRDFYYTPMREPGNKDTLGGGGGKPFSIEGALLHRFVHCPQAVLGGVSKVSSTYLESLKSAKEAFLASLGCMVEGTLAAHPLRGLRYGPRFPRCFNPDERPKCRLLLGQSYAEGDLSAAVLAVAKSPPELRWTGGDKGDRCLEVLVRRPDFTPCFAAVAIATEDWIQLCWTADNSIDLEVLAILHLGLRDRRQLWHIATPVCQCLFFHDLRVKELPEASSLDALQIMDIICKVCGEEILLEAFEKEAPVGERHWRIFLCSVSAALDEKAAYQAYQAVRNACAKIVTLC